MLTDEKLQRFDWKTSRVRLWDDVPFSTPCTTQSQRFDCSRSWVPTLRDWRRRARKAEKGQ
jgi:hypothetical protein